MPTASGDLLKRAIEELHAPKDPPPFASIILPLIRNVMPSMIASSIIGVQPMQAPSGNIFSVRPVFASPPRPKTLKEQIQDILNASSVLS